MHQLHKAKQYQLTYHTKWHKIDVWFLVVFALVVASTTCRVIVNEFHPTTQD